MLTLTAEGKLEAAVAEASSATAQLQQLGPASSQRAAQAAAAGQPFSYGQQQAAQYQQQVAQYQQSAAQQYQPAAPQYRQAAPPAAQQPATDAGGSITIVYETGWNNAHLHFNAGAAWEGGSALLAVHPIADTASRPGLQGRLGFGMPAGGGCTRRAPAALAQPCRDVVLGTGAIGWLRPKD